MHVFVTGATGWVGSRVVDELLRRGHSVLGLARSDASAAALEAKGVAVQRGGIEDLESLKAGVTQCDATIHTAFIHDFSDYVGSLGKDLVATKAMIDALKGTGKTFINTSGTAVTKWGTLAREDDGGDMSMFGGTGGRAQGENLATEETSIRGMVIRLPPSVHGKGDKGFVPMLIEFAKKGGCSAYLGEGTNIWPGVHVDDAARCYVDALEKGKAGARYHAVGDSPGVHFKEIAQVIGTKLSLPTKSLAAGSDEAVAHFTWLAMFAAADNPVSNDKTRAELGWEPTRLGLLDDIVTNYP